MCTRLLILILLVALGGPGAVLGSARPAAPSNPPAGASLAEPSSSTSPMETYRLSLSIEEWLSKLGIMQPPRATAEAGELGSRWGAPVLSILNGASDLPASISRWFCATGAAPERSGPLDRGRPVGGDAGAGR